MCDPSHLLRALQVPEDYVRNFLRNAGLQRTLEQFETEWYEVRGQYADAGSAQRSVTPTCARAAQLQAQGQLTLEGTAPVPDVYARVQELEDVVKVCVSVSLVRESTHALTRAPALPRHLFVCRPCVRS